MTYPLQLYGIVVHFDYLTLLSEKRFANDRRDKIT